MIEKLKVTVAGSEVKELAFKRVKRLREKATTTREQAKLLDGAQLQGQYTGHSNNTNPAKDLEKQANDFDAQADELQFIGDHLVPDETYQLDRDDLRHLGIVRGHW